MNTAARSQSKRPRPTNPQTSILRSNDMYINNLLINESLSRARMRSPQDTISEASRPARLITLHARRVERIRRANQ
jgi:hypothetical protein